MELENKIDKGPLLGIRHLQTVLLFLSKVVICMLQSHVPVTIVAMTNAERSNPEFKEYHWTEKQKLFIISSFFFGGVISLIPGAYWIRRFGVKINLFIVILCTGVFNALVPFCVPWGGWKIFCLLRFMQGLFLHVAHPACMQHLANWSPPTERNRVGAVAEIGLEVGMISTLLLSGVISKSSFGWPGVFYVTSLLSFLWCLLWFIFGAESVDDAKFITHKERVYIEESHKNSLEFQKRKLPIPWRAIFTSIPFWSLIITRATENFCYFTIHSEYPNYINAIFKVNITENGLFSALPFLAGSLITITFGPIADFIQKRRLLTLTTMRKCFNSFGIWTPAAGILWIAYLDEKQKLLTVIIVTLMMCPSSAVQYGGILACIDIAPNHTEIIAALSEFFGGVLLLCGPLVAGAIVEDANNRFEWRILFAVLAAVYCLGDLIFLIWGSCEVQPWNEPDYLTNKNKNEVIESKYTKKQNEDIYTISM